jgi:hypothetical protein
MRLTAAAVLALISTSPAVAQSVPVYDTDWYRASFWGGEYPPGFTVLADTVIQLRPDLASVPATIECPLPARATLHPWNMSRVEQMGLGFVTYTEIQEWEVTEPYEAMLYDEGTYYDAQVSFAPGDRFRFLTYYAEGTYLMEFEGTQYTGDQALLEVSRQIGSADRMDQWMRINCPNNQWGWLYLPDLVVDETVIGGPNIVEYGRAADLE